MRYNLFFLDQVLLIDDGSRIVLNDEDAIIAPLFCYIVLKLCRSLGVVLGKKRDIKI